MQAQRNDFVLGACVRAAATRRCDLRFCSSGLLNTASTRATRWWVALVAYLRCLRRTSRSSSWPRSMTLDMGIHKLRGIPRGGRTARHQGRSALGQSLGGRFRRRRQYDIYALAALKGVGKQAVEAIITARDNRGFADFADFAARINPRAVNKRVLESLGAAGAFDAFEKNRARVFAAVDTVLGHAQRVHDTAAMGQSELFGGGTRERSRCRRSRHGCRLNGCGVNMKRSGFSCRAIRSMITRPF